MQALNRSLQTAPKISILGLLSSISLYKQQTSVLQKIGLTLVLRGKFGCKTATNIATPSTYVTKEQNRWDSAGNTTLQSRILEYFRRNSKYSHNLTLSSTTRPTSLSIMQQDKPLKKRLTHLPTLNHSQLAEFIHAIHDQSVTDSLDDTQFDCLISILDEECCDRIGILSPREVTAMLDAWMNCMPKNMTSLQFYSSFLKRMNTWLSDPYLPVEDFIKLIFYVGFGKKSDPINSIMYLVTNIVEENIDLQSLSIEELCIVTNTFFKASVKISSKVLAIVNDAVIKNFDVLIKDPALLTTLVKVIRHAQNYDYKLIDTVSSKMLSNVSATDSLGFTAKSHILAWYACTLYERLDILHFLVKSSQNDIIRSRDFNEMVIPNKSVHLSIHYRSKDISRFLWSLSNLNYRTTTSGLDCIKSMIIPELRTRFKRGDYIKNPNEIIDSLLSLWILGFKDVTLLADVVSSKHLAVGLFGKNQALYHSSRLALLLTCAAMEAPGVLTNDQVSLRNSLPVLLTPKLNKYLNTRPLLKKVHRIVRCIVLKTSSVSCIFVIPHLHIAGIKVNMESRPIYIEILDPTVCLYKSRKPHGLMQLKLRLMEALHYQVIVIDGHEIEKRSDQSSSLYEYIQEKIVSAAIC